MRSSFVLVGFVLIFSSAASASVGLGIAHIEGGRACTVTVEKLTAKTAVITRPVDVENESEMCLILPAEIPIKYVEALELQQRSMLDGFFSNTYFRMDQLVAVKVQDQEACLGRVSALANDQYAKITFLKTQREDCTKFLKGWLGLKNITPLD